MRSLSEAELLDVWEQGRSLPPVQQALLALAAASPGSSPEELADLPVGQRDGRLLALRERTFGPTLSGVVTCPNHGERLELAFTVDDILVQSEVEPGPNLSVARNGYDVHFRLPNSRDMMAVRQHDSVEDARRTLLRRCLVTVRHGDENIPVEEFPDHVFDQVATAVAEEMEKADPQASTRLHIICPVCDHQWEAPFDIVPYFWAELDARARRVLQEIHILASSYGWSEVEILALSPARRRLYLEVISS